MILVTIELVPHGDMNRRSHIGTMIISNDVTGTLTKGNYRVWLSKRDNPKKPWRKGRLTGFPRRRLGPYDLMYRALRELVGERNPGEAQGTMVEIDDIPETEPT